MQSKTIDIYGLIVIGDQIDTYVFTSVEECNQKELEVKAEELTVRGIIKEEDSDYAVLEMWEKYRADCDCNCLEICEFFQTIEIPL